jgi:hypothetical protein
VDQQGDLDAVVEVELGEDGRDVGLDGGDAEVEHGPDLGVGPALADRDGDLAFAAALVASRPFFARPENRLGVAMGVGLLAVTANVVAGWSRRAGWGATHRLALAGGALLTDAWGGFVLLSLEAPRPPSTWSARPSSSSAQGRYSPPPPGARRAVGVVA